MHKVLTRSNLHGVWAAIATPFDDDDRFDAEVLRENMRRLHAAGVHGIYTTDSDGEFYAIELDEYQRIIDVFSEEAHRLGIPTQVGVTWTNTRGIVNRLRYAAERGILGAHVGHPYFMPMSSESYRVFWEDVRQAVPESFALIHYNTPRVHNYQRGPDYAVLQGEISNLVGTKHVGSDFPEFLTLVSEAPELSHFTSEHAFTPYTLFGARGIYSWFVNFNAHYMVAWYDDLCAGRWQEAIHRQRRMHAFMRASEVLHEGGAGICTVCSGRRLRPVHPSWSPTTARAAPTSPCVRNACNSSAGLSTTNSLICAGLANRQPLRTLAQCR
jgi:4-hydroxy-tetrahydrodipicolinate synthase